MNNSKHWSICCLALALLLLILFGGATAVIDPYFHYHEPLEQLEYPLNNQRYQNDGIAKNFPYTAIITGTSMTENYKTSEFDQLFGVNSVKLSYSGGTFQELTATVETAIRANPELKLVLFCIDEWFIFNGRDMILADGEYPTYLYDSNPFNDVKYLLNKSTFCTDTIGVLEYTRQGGITTSFDNFGSWTHIPIGRDHAIAQYARKERVTEEKVLTEELTTRISDSLNASILALARENPNITFLCYFPPYSILNWDAHDRAGTLERQVEAFCTATELMLPAENIQLFSFCTDFDTITNLDNYRDSVHHSQQINTLLLQRMAKQEYLLTEETYRQHWQQVMDFYSTYDYESIFEETA